MVFRAAIFDLDGVIVDTVPLHFKAWKKMFAEYGRDFTFDDYKEKVDGIPRMDGARAILTGFSDEKLNEAAEKKQGYYLEALRTDKLTEYESTRNLIKEFRSRGVKVAVISSSRNCPHILEKIDYYPLIETAISGNDIAKGKPDPQIFFMAAERLGVKPEESVVFEDAVLGVEAAGRGGFKCVGVDRHNGPGRLGKADIIVKDLSEVNYESLRKRFF